MVGMFMMQSVAIHPGDRIYIEPEDVVHSRDGFYEPFLVVERAVSDSQMENIRQIQPAHKPTKDKIDSRDQQSNPGSQMSWGGIHTSQHVAQNNQIARDIVYFHCGSPGGYSIRNGGLFQMTSSTSFPHGRGSGPTMGDQRHEGGSESPVRSQSLWMRQKPSGVPAKSSPLAIHQQVVFAIRQPIRQVRFHNPVI